MRVAASSGNSSGSYPDVTGVLLAGGKSRRMGKDKARLQLNGRPLFSRMLELMQRLFAEVIIAGDRPDLSRPDVRCVPDIYPGSALGGLYTGLTAAGSDWIFVAPCDIPFPDVRIIETLLANRAGVAAVVPHSQNGYEPVFALYHKSCRPHMEQLLRSQRYRITDFYPQIQLRDLDSRHFPPGWEQNLMNINTPEDLIRAEREKNEATSRFCCREERNRQNHPA